MQYCLRLIVVLNISPSRVWRVRNSRYSLMSLSVVVNS